MYSFGYLGLSARDTPKASGLETAQALGLKWIGPQSFLPQEVGWFLNETAVALRFQLRGLGPVFGPNGPNGGIPETIGGGVLPTVPSDVHVHILQPCGRSLNIYDPMGRSGSRQFP